MNDFNTALLNLSDDEIESLNTFRIDDTFHYRVTLKKKPHNCHYCGGKTIGHGKKEIKIHHPNLIVFNGVIHYLARRYLCCECGKTFFEENPFTFERFRNSYAVINRIMINLSDLDLSFSRIADLNLVSTTTVINYLDSYVSLAKPALPVSLGIDELHSYMSASDSAYLCILIDNVERHPIDVLRSRSKHNLNKHFESYSKSERDKVLFVTIDMWKPYKDVALRNFKNAKIAVDPFHVVKNVCDAFSKVRVNIMNQSPYGSDAYYLLKKWHWLIEKSKIDLDNEPKYNSHFKRKLNHRQLQNMIFDISERLFDAYDLKCRYQLFNEHATADNCELLFDRLLIKFQSTYISEFRSVTETLINWKHEILNSFLRPFDDRKLSNSLAENINSRLRTYISLTNGISNFIRFKKRVLLTLNPRIYYSISGHISSDKIIKKSHSRNSF